MIKPLVGALAMATLAALPLSAAAQSRMSYGAHAAPQASFHASAVHGGGGYHPSYGRMHASPGGGYHSYAMNRGDYGTGAYRTAGAGRAYAANRIDHGQAFDHRGFDRRDVGRHDFGDRRFFRGAYDIAIGPSYGYGYGDYGYETPYAGDYGYDSSYASDAPDSYGSDSYSNGYSDQGGGQDYIYQSDTGANLAAGQGYRDDGGGYADQAGRDDDGWSAGAPPADCGQWVWRERMNRYQWVPAAC
jgi:hypothetical protein